MAYAYDADGNLLYGISNTNSIDYVWRSELYHLPGDNAATAYDHLNRINGFYRGEIVGGWTGNTGPTSVEQSNIVYYAPGGITTQIPTAYVKAPSAQWNATAGTQGNYDVVQAQNEDIQRDHVYQKPLPSLSQQFNLGTTLDNPRRDLFLTYDAWGRPVSQAAASLVMAGGTNYHYDRPFSKTFTYDALGRRITEKYTDRNNSTWTIHLYLNGAGDAVQETRQVGAGTPYVYAQYVYSAAGPGLVVERDDTDTNGQPERVWVMQGPDGSTWTTRLHLGNSFAFGEYLYTADGQPTFITHSNMGSLNYNFAPDSPYGYNYLWHGGRRSMDQDLSTRSTLDTATNAAQGNTAFVDRADGLLWLNGQIYDSGQAAPLAEDVYAYRRTPGAAGAGDVNAYEHSKRTFIQTAMVHNGTQPFWSVPTTGLAGRVLSEVSWLGTFATSFADEVGGRVGGMAQGLWNSVTDLPGTENLSHKPDQPARR